MSPKLCLLGLLFLIACTDGTTPDDTSTTTIPPLTSSTIDPAEVAPTEAGDSHFAAGIELDVVGIPFDESMFVMPDPIDLTSGGLFQPDRLDNSLIATGEAIVGSDGDVWEELEGDTPASASREFFAYFQQKHLGVVGEFEDTSDDFAGQTGSEVEALLFDVATSIADSQGLTVVQITRREFGGRELYFDLLSDDAEVSRGLRLRVVAEEADDAFAITEVEQAPICQIMLDPSGVCT